MAKEASKEAEKGHKSDMGDFLLCTTGVPPGYKLVEVLGMAWGTELRSVGLRENLAAFFKGRKGRMSPDLKMIMLARKESVERMVQSAKNLGANGLVGVQLNGFNFRFNSVEFTSYGTAVIVERV